MGETDWGKLGLILMSEVMPSKFLIQFFVDGQDWCAQRFVCALLESLPSPVEVL